MNQKKLTAGVMIICAFLFLVMTGPAYASSTTEKEVKATTHKVKTVKQEVKATTKGKAKTPEKKVTKKRTSDSKKETVNKTAKKVNKEAKSKRGDLNSVKKDTENKKTKTISKSQSNVTAKPFSGKVNINKATLEDLQQISGIGPAKAQSILDYKKQHGTFKKAEDLLNVKGIGKGSLDKMKKHMTF